MDKKITFIVLGLIAMSVAVSGCIGGDSNTTTFSNNGISFDYPSDWEELSQEELSQFAGNSSDSRFLAVVGKNDSGNQSTVFGVMELDNNASSGVNAKLIADFFASGFEQSGVKATSNTTKVDNNPAYMITAADNSTAKESYLSLIFFDKADKMYMLVYATPEKDTETLDKILTSFKFT